MTPAPRPPRARTRSARSTALRTSGSAPRGPMPRVEPLLGRLGQIAHLQDRRADEPQHAAELGDRHQEQRLADTEQAAEEAADDRADRPDAHVDEPERAVRTAADAI